MATTTYDPAGPSATSVSPTRTAGADPQHLLAAARTGDELAWAELTRRYGALVHSVSRRQGIYGTETADIAQTTWLRLLTHIDEIHSPRGLGAWLATTATRECHAHRRRHGREAPVEVQRLESGVRVSPQEELVDRLDRVRRAHLLLEALKRLPARQRQLIEIMLSDETPSYKEIAERLDMPLGAIGPVRQRALRQLRHLLEAQGCTGSGS